MRPSMLAWPAALVLVSLTALGCSNKISVDDTDPDPDPGCEGERPEIPENAWCPPSYECIDGQWVDTAGACPEPLCPDYKPSDGTSCQVVGQVCNYQEDIPCGETEQVSVHCTDNGWIATYNYCQPEPECPDDLPVAGTDCAGWDFAYSCQYLLQTACGEEMVFLACTGTEQGQTWTIQSGSTCAICKDHDTDAECALAPECQWLTPGCGDEPTQTGCYPKVGCDVAGCPTDDSICVETTYDPCYGQPCEACGASFFACLPSWAP